MNCAVQTAAGTFSLFRSIFVTPHAETRLVFMFTLTLFLWFYSFIFSVGSSALLLLLHPSSAFFSSSCWFHFFSHNINSWDLFLLFTLLMSVFHPHHLLLTPSFCLLLSLPPPPPPPGPNRSKLQDMLANLRDAEDLPSMQPPMTPPSRPPVPRLNEHELGRPEDGNLPSFSVH